MATFLTKEQELESRIKELERVTAKLQMSEMEKESEKQATLPIHDIMHYTFNLNTQVKVKLKDLGYQRLADQHNAYIETIPKWEKRDADYYKSQADEWGYTKFQMWRFMEEFGEVTKIGMGEYYHLDIIIGAKDLEPCA